VRRVHESGLQLNHVARELGLSPNTLSSWKRQYQAEQKEAFPGNGRQSSQATLVSRPCRENERLRQERDIQKKQPLLRERKRVWFRVPAAHVVAYPVGLMCRALKVSYACYWSWRWRPVGERELEECQLPVAIGGVRGERPHARQPARIPQAAAPRDEMQQG